LNPQENFPGIEQSYLEMSNKTKQFIELLYKDLSIR